jgi:Domain of unknown function (DUF4389)
LTTDLEQPTPDPARVPVQFRVIEDLSRNRWTVFFRVILAIPDLIWLALWSIGAFIVVFFAWFAVLFSGRMPDGMHRFFTMYIRYATHVYAYIYLASNSYPGFLGEGYEVDVEFDQPERQNRWKTGFRFFLALPAFLLSSALAGGLSYSYTSTSSNSTATNYGLRVTGVLATCAILSWFYSLIKGRAPEGIARLQWYALHYGAQVAAYFFLVTDRYPTSDPERVGVPWPAAEHPIRLAHDPDDGVRSRLTVFFRLLLAIPHFVWLLLWGIAAFVVAIVNWLATLIGGQSPQALHNFLAAYLRYETHLFAFVALVSNPFPGFTGTPGSYPVDVQVDPPQSQNRWEVFFRIFLVIPAAFVSSALFGALYAAAILGWFASLFTAHMPSGLRKLGLMALRYGAQTNGYGYMLLTARYPYAGPPA